MKPLALDLFCGAGGVSRGLADAGFEVWGIDIEPQPRYIHPGRFVQGDALNPPFDLRDFDFIWASPPCQAYSWSARRWLGIERADLLPDTREMLLDSGMPCAIENVVGAPLRQDLVLTGQMFGLRVIRRRHFELHEFWCFTPAHIAPGRVGFGPEDFVTVAGHGGNGSARLDNWRDAMGINWMTKTELSQAIPPAYAEYIGREFLRQKMSEAAE